MERLLAINNYLPSELDVEDIVTLVNTVFSTSHVINSVIEPQITLIDLPNDIQRLIMENNHPYYMRGYYMSNSQTYSLFEREKDNLLRIWCNETEKREYDLDLNQLVDLALVYHPIPESVHYWDRITLFYYACKNNYSHPDDILTGFFPGDDDNIEYIPWICYKFKRVDVLLRLRNQFKSFPNLYESISEIYQYITFITSYRKSRDTSMRIQQLTWNFINSFINWFPYLAGSLLTNEEAIELVVIMRIFNYFDATNISIYEVIINGPDEDLMHNLDIPGPDEIATVAALNSAYKIGVNKVKAILQQYDVTDNIETEYNSPIKIDNSVIEKLTNRKVNLDTFEDDWTYALTSGYLYEYEVSDLSCDNEITLVNAGVNEFGLITFNRHFLKVFMSTYTSDFSTLQMCHYRYIYNYYLLEREQ